MIVHISSDQSFAVRNGRPCVKSYDSDLYHAMSIHTVRMTFIMVMSLKESRRHAREIESGGLPTLLHETLTL